VIDKYKICEKSRANVAGAFAQTIQQNGSLEIVKRGEKSEIDKELRLKLLKTIKNNGAT
jgi:hypothetical protein